jgi:hypothetical protein
MEERRVVTPPSGPPPAGAPTICVCPVPIPEVHADRKGAARTHCARCGLPVRIDFAR